MIRKTSAVLVLLCVMVSFSGCVDRDEYAVLYSAVERANAETYYSNTFTFTIVNADTDSTVCFTQGRANIDKTDSLRMNGTMTQFVLGEYSSANIAYADGMYYTEIGDSKVMLEMDEVSILSEFLCGSTPLFPISDVKSLKTETDGLYKTYTFTCNGDDAVLSKLIGSDVYVLVGALSIDDELTEYSEVSCVYVLTDGGEDSVLVSRSLSFTIHAYSELPYIAGKTVNKEDYLTNIHIDCSQTYTQFGSCEVTLPDPSEYATYGSEASESSTVFEVTGNT